MHFSSTAFSKKTPIMILAIKSLTICNSAQYKGISVQFIGYFVEFKIKDTLFRDTPHIYQPYNLDTFL